MVVVAARKRQRVRPCPGDGNEGTADWRTEPHFTSLPGLVGACVEAAVACCFGVLSFMKLIQVKSAVRSVRFGRLVGVRVTTLTGFM